MSCFLKAHSPSSLPYMLPHSSSFLLYLPLVSSSLHLMPEPVLRWQLRHNRMAPLASSKQLVSELHNDTAAMWVSRRKRTEYKKINRNGQGKKTNTMSCLNHKERVKLHGHHMLCVHKVYAEPIAVCGHGCRLCYLLITILLPPPPWHCLTHTRTHTHNTQQMLHLPRGRLDLHWINNSSSHISSNTQKQPLNVGFGIKKGDNGLKL